MSRGYAHQGPSVELVRTAFATAGLPVKQLGVSGRGADLLVDDTYLISVRAMHGAEVATHKTLVKWWETAERLEPYIPVMVVRGARGFTTLGWSVWLDGAHAGAPALAGVPVRLWFDDFLRFTAL